MWTKSKERKGFSVIREMARVLGLLSPAFQCDCLVLSFLLSLTRFSQAGENSLIRLVLYNQHFMCESKIAEFEFPIRVLLFGSSSKDNALDKSKPEGAQATRRAAE